ncbi:hypothetical protein CEXT_221621 [Caerostris extrusa]|uniref:Uncharacterized protein n=1 Tax=Caerostris extrusa TaxID=172846 RepID=A0AAV4QBE4_CAEEX|nr:hypothetical protein CEXT_221621 [Caerostris extrusa]
MLPTATRLHSQESAICSPFHSVVLFGKRALNTSPWLPLEALNRGTKRVGGKETHHNLQLRFHPATPHTVPYPLNPYLHTEKSPKYLTATRTEALNRGTKRVGGKETHHNLQLQFQPG